MHIRNLNHLKKNLRDSFNYEATMELVGDPLSWYSHDHKALQSHLLTLEARWKGMHDTVARLHEDDAHGASEAARKQVASEQESTAEFRAFAARQVRRAVREGARVSNPFGTASPLGPHLSQLLEREDDLTSKEYADVSTHYDHLGELVEIARSRME